MKRLLILLSLFFFPLEPLQAADSPKAGSKPNIVLILADDLGYECIGANGGKSYRTPNLDRLAREGVRFEHCYAQPNCTPTRVQLLTGMSNVRNYVDFGALDKSQTTFGHIFWRAGWLAGMPSGRRSPRARPGCSRSMRQRIVPSGSPPTGISCRDMWIW